MEQIAERLTACGAKLRSKQMQRTVERVQECGSVLVTEWGKIWADTPENRAKACNHCWVVESDRHYFLQFAVCVDGKAYRRKWSKIEREFKAKRKVLRASTDKMREKPERLESRERMFKIGQGEVCHKKPGSGGSFTTKPRLMCMALNRGDMERNRVSNWSICIFPTV